MNDVFDRIAAQALGLGVALRPRPRSRFEPDSVDLDSDDPAVNVRETVRPIDPLPPPDQRHIRHQVGIAAPRRAFPTPSMEAEVETTSRAAPLQKRETASPLQSGPAVPTMEADQPRSPQSSGRGTAAFEPPSPEPVALAPPFIAAPSQVISSGSEQRSPQAAPTEVPPGARARPPISRGADADLDIDRLLETRSEKAPSLASPPSPPQRSAPEGERRSASDQAAPEQGHETDFESRQPPRGEPGQPARPRQTRPPVRPADAPRPPDIEITIGRLEIRAEPPAASRPAKPFQPHLDLAAYRARRKGAP